MDKCLEGDAMTFEPNDGKRILRTFKAGGLGWDDALDLLAGVDWATEEDPGSVPLADNSWRLVEAMLHGLPGYADFRDELVERVRERREA